MQLGHVKPALKYATLKHKPSKFQLGLGEMASFVGYSIVLPHFSRTVEEWLVIAFCERGGAKRCRVSSVAAVPN